jgi:hypothetical protein
MALTIATALTVRGTTIPTLAISGIRLIHILGIVRTGVVWMLIRVRRLLLLM